MTSPHIARSAPTSWGTARLLATAFVAIAALFALTTLPVLLRAREIERGTGAIASSAIASITLVARMSRDVEGRRLLVDAHIFENDEVAMKDVEQRIAALDADFRAAAASYEVLATSAEERATYERLRAEVSSTERDVDAALALSRENRDADARRALAATEPRFRAVEDALDDLVRLDRRGAARAFDRIVELQRSGLRALGILALAGIALTAAVGVFTTRMAARRDELVRAHARALQARNDELYAFAGRVAHDLRRPLGTATLAAAAVERTAPEQRARTLQALDRSLKGMAALIEDLLTLSQLDAEHREIACDPSEVVAALMVDVAPGLRRGGGAVEVDVEPSSVLCIGEGLLRQALWNLVENATKYRREQVPLRLAVRGRPAHGRYVLEVADNGAGMSEADAARIFEPLYRGASSHGIEGTGLGLSIVKRVVEASGGKVSVRSRAGVGTTFAVELPLAATRPAGRAAAGDGAQHPPR